MRHAPVIFGGFVVVLVAVILAPMIIDFTGTDTDEHGSVPVPGVRVLELPEGEVGVYYGERRRMPGRRRGDTVVPDSLPVPPLDVRAAPVDGGAEAGLRAAYDGIQVGSGGRTTRQFAVLDVPSGGGYRVSVSAGERIRYPEPRLSLGTDSTRTTTWSVSEWLLDHLVLVILVGLGLLVAVMLAPAYLSGGRGGRRGPPPGTGAGDAPVNLRL